MDKYKYEPTRCWIYAYGLFTDQAHRFSLITSLGPRAARDAVARLHGFGNWAKLAQTLQDLQDIGCLLALDMELGPNEVSFRKSVFAQVERLASLDSSAKIQDISRKLSPKYKGVAADQEGEEFFSETEYEAWGQYEQIKWEMAYRTLWAREGANSSSVQNIGIELAERLTAWYPSLAPDVRSALKIVFDFYGCSPESSSICSVGPISDYLGKEQSKPRRICETLGLSFNESMQWRSAPSLWRDLAYSDPSELDGAYDSFPILALLPHAPRDTYLQVHVEKDGMAALWCDTLIPDATGLAQLAFIGAGAALEVSVVDIHTAQVVLNSPEKAGWLKVTWNI